VSTASTHPRAVRRNPVKRLPASAWRQLCAAAPRLLLVWALLPVAGIARLRRWLRIDVPAGRAASVTDADIEQRVLALRRIGARLPGCHCLARSIALAWWLDAKSMPNTVRIGVTGTSIDLRAHSWVELDGRPVDDTPENIARFRKIHEI